MKKGEQRVAVIGAGASGLTAAISAARNGAHVTLFEKQKKAGRKILASGNGQCNLSNRNISVEHFHGNNSRFANSIISRFSVDDVYHFFGSIGIPLREKDDGRMYPFSLQAKTVLHALLTEAERLKINLNLHRRVDLIVPDRENDTGIVIETAGRERARFDSVVLAMGGRSYGSLGGTAASYRLLESLGHTIVCQIPSIVPLNIPVNKIHTLQGLKWDCLLTVLLNDKPVREEYGEVLFTSYGISGPASLALSGCVNRAVHEGVSVKIEIDFMPDMSREDLAVFIANFADARSLKEVLDSIFKYRMGDFFLHYSGIDGTGRADSLTSAALEQLLSVIKGCSVDAGKIRSFDEAAVTAGGVSVDEVDQRTLVSKCCPGVYLAGELLDIDGDCGGYNLHFAWATGVIAGQHAAFGTKQS